MRTKKIVFFIVLISIFFVLSQSVNATVIINKEIRKDDLKHIENKIILANEHIKKILSSDGIESLHDIVMIVWEMISIFIGHNVVSMFLARLCCCWFVFPLVVVNNILNVNISGGGGILALIQEYFEGFPFDDLIYQFGALFLLFLPVMYVLVFFMALVSILTDGSHIEGGVLDGIREDLAYIYTFGQDLGDFKPDNNNKSNYTFYKYVMSFDTKGYFYHTGFFGLAMSPIIIFFLGFHYHNLVRSVD